MLSEKQLTLSGSLLALPWRHQHWVLEWLGWAVVAPSPAGNPGLEECPFPWFPGVELYVVSHPMPHPAAHGHCPTQPTDTAGTMLSWLPGAVGTVLGWAALAPVEVLNVFRCGQTDGQLSGHSPRSVPPTKGCTPWLCIREWWGARPLAVWAPASCGNLERCGKESCGALRFQVSRV